jgi:hypothetical protein
MKGKARTDGVAEMGIVRVDGGAKPRLTSGGEAGLNDTLASFVLDSV